jgi:predicted Zn-dependent peptidase
MLSPHPGQAYWVQTADVTASVTGLSIKEILYEIERLRTEAPPEDELEGVKRHMVGSFLVRNASRAGIITQLAFVDLHRLDPDYLSDYVKRVMAVTPQDVRRIAREYLVPDRMSLVVVGDVKTIRAQVARWSKR